MPPPARPRPAVAAPPAALVVPASTGGVAVDATRAAVSPAPAPPRSTSLSGFGADRAALEHFRAAAAEPHVADDAREGVDPRVSALPVHQKMLVYLSASQIKANADTIAYNAVVNADAGFPGAVAFLTSLLGTNLVFPQHRDVYACAVEPRDEPRPMAPLSTAGAPASVFGTYDRAAGVDAPTPVVPPAAVEAAIEAAAKRASERRLRDYCDASGTAVLRSCCPMRCPPDSRKGQTAHCGGALFLSEQRRAREAELLRKREVAAHLRNVWDQKREEGTASIADGGFCDASGKAVERAYCRMGCPATETHVACGGALCLKSGRERTRYSFLSAEGPTKGSVWRFVLQRRGRRPVPAEELLPLQGRSVRRRLL